MTKLVLIVFFVFLSILNWYSPHQIFSYGQVSTFTLISVKLLEDFAWILLKELWKSIKNSCCELLFKKKQDSVINEEKKAKEND